MKIIDISEKRKKQKQRFSLTLLLAFIVFVILLVALSLAALTIYLLIESDVIVSIDGQVDFGSLLLFMSLISLVIGSALIVLLGKIPLSPINKLVNGMNNLADGNFETRLEYGGPIENHPAFVEISESFNKMAEQLQNTEMLRGDFINNFSHEFKTPIVSIAGLAKLVNKGDISEEEKKAYLLAIETESMRLANMATNVLNLTKVENQTILTDVNTYNISEQIRTCVLLLENQWSSKNIELSLDFDEYEIKANEELMKQVFINLLDNAIKFSPEGGVVSVEIFEDTSHISVAIKNSGDEIPKDKIDKIFNKFYQADESHAAKGNGVGLAIVKKIVTLHNGKINVKSEDGETTFTAILPTHKKQVK